MVRWPYNCAFVLILAIDNLGLSHAANEATVLCNTLENTCYEAKYVKNPMTWEDANQECEQEGAALPDEHFNNYIKSGNTSSVYVRLLHNNGTWISSRSKSSEAQTCFIQKADHRGHVKNKKRDCHKKHSFICLYHEDINRNCPSESWVYCPEPRRKVFLGDDLTLRCEHSTAFDFCEWRLRSMIFRSSSFSFDSDPQVTVVNDTSCELRIPSVTEEHVGRWQCQGYGVDYVNVSLLLNDGLKRPILWINNEAGSIARIHENKENTVTCKAEENNISLQLILMNDGKPTTLPSETDVSQESGITSTTVMLSRQEIEASVLSSDVKVVCQANSINGNTSRTTHLDLLYAPRVIQPPTKISSEIGQRLEYTFKLRANPKPTDVYLDIITTSTQHARLYPGNHYYMKHKYELGILEIEDTIGHQYKIDIIFHQLQLNDSYHDYWFVVKNEEGESRINFAIEYRIAHTPELPTDAELEQLVKHEDVVANELSSASTAAILLTIVALVLGLAVIAAIYTYNRRKMRMRSREKLKDSIQVNVKDLIDENCNKTRESSYEEQMDKLLCQEPNHVSAKVES